MTVNDKIVFNISQIIGSYIPSDCDMSAHSCAVSVFEYLLKARQEATKPMKPLSELANDEEACRKVWSYIFPSTHAKLERFYSLDSCVIFTGDNGDMVPDESRLELFFDGSFYCCIYRRNQEIDEGIGNIFGFVDKIRSLGYQPTTETKEKQ